MKKLIATILLGLITLNSNAQTTKKVLFLGNSYTYYNSMPAMVANLATSKGNTLVYDSNTPGGHRLLHHSTNTTSLQKIASDDWDYVVLQGQSQEVAFPDAQLASEVYPYAEILNDSVKSNNECSETMFFMTWGRENGDAGNCGFFPPFCTYDGMQSRLKYGYTNMANDNDGSVAPVGEAWRYIRNNHPTIDLYSPDESHPSLEGSYLAACVFYVSVYRESISGSTFNAGVDPTDAAIIQNVADMVVLDSLDNWNIGAYDAVADYTFSNNGNEYTFINNSLNADSYQWHFGDGSSSTDTDPIHNYTGPGTYVTWMVASNGCTSDTMELEIIISPFNSLDENESKINLIKTQDFIALQDYNVIQAFEVFSTGGQIILNSTSKTSKIDISGLDHGIYILRMEVNGKEILTKFSR